MKTILWMILKAVVFGPVGVFGISHQLPVKFIDRAAAGWWVVVTGLLLWYVVQR
jgi:hypothetical protein